MNYKMKRILGAFIVCIPIILVFIKSSIDSGFVETSKMFLSYIGFLSICVALPVIGLCMVLSSFLDESMKENKKSNEKEE